MKSVFITPSPLWRRQALRLRCLLALMAFIGGLGAPFASVTGEPLPLAPPDTTSPLSTLNFFRKHIDLAYAIQLNEGFKNPEARSHVENASRSLDLHEVAPADRDDVAFEAALLLKEVIDRLELPPEDEIPNSNTVSKMEIVAWTIPKTEITITKIEEGANKGQFLFSAATVDRVREFYERIKDLPYREGASVGIYEDYIFSPGPLIPNRIINALPAWAHAGYWEQAVWQWLGALMLLGVGGAVVLMVFRWSHVKEKGASRTTGRLSWQRFMAPLALLAVTMALKYLIDVQINLTGAVAEYFTGVMRIIGIFVGAWFILLAGEGVSEVIISATRLRSRRMDPNLTRILCKLGTWLLLFVLILNVSEYLGVSVKTAFASAGIAGLALALAARETLANFFGGISILMDRPFKTGDFILLESGERGMVVNVGIRSTRLLTRDDIQIAIPNSIITNTKVINESAPQPRFRVRIKVGVTYDADIDHVETTLLEITQANQLVCKSPEPRVRFRSFGDSALDFELLCWANNPIDKGRLIHELNRAIYKAFKAEGIEIPFPQRDVHLIKDD
ncbi:MAG: mechanosensitive ion channel family protein [Desulfobacterales bacterium]|nr:mechanosensitive ion channel family protein [Desulfobacterales bacterium]